MTAAHGVIDVVQQRQLYILVSNVTDFATKFYKEEKITVASKLPECIFRPVTDDLRENGDISSNINKIPIYKEPESLEAQKWTGTDKLKKLMKTRPKMAARKMQRPSESTDNTSRA